MSSLEDKLEARSSARILHNGIIRMLKKCSIDSQPREKERERGETGRKRK